jgi:hypothetical protein
LISKNQDAIMKDYILPYLDWECLNEPMTITQVEDRTELPVGKKKIMVNRDNEYNLLGTLYFKDSPREVAWRHPSNIAGEVSKGFDINGSSDLANCTLESCLIGDTTIHGIQPEHQESLDTAVLIFKGLRVRYKNEKEATHLAQWCVNGPKGHVFSRSTERKLTRHFSRERFLSKDQKMDSVERSLESNSFGTDFLWVKTDEIQFMVTKVPEGIGPEWSTNIGIEYRKEWGRLPEIVERARIEELCSFVFGRQLLPVGYTLYDDDENIVEYYAHNPWGRRARAFCSEPDYPPISVDIFASWKVENIISRLLPKYLELQEPLCLKEALWNIWISRQTPIGSNLPILAAALESIVNGWFKYKTSQSKGVYMEKKVFAALLKDEIEIMRKRLEENLSENPTGDSKAEKIINNVLRSYQFGTMERYRIFFKEINLPVDTYEWDAVKARHKFVHGETQFDKTDWNLVLRQVNTFETSLNKVLLSLLGYSGDYIDRSMIPWNNKVLN